MEVMHRIIAGLDVHAKQVVACLQIQQGKRARRTLREFSATTPGLLGRRGLLTARAHQRGW